MDDVTNQRLKAIEDQILEVKNEMNRRYGSLNGNVAAAREDLAKHRSEMVDAFRNLDLRVTTEIRETANLVRDLKAWLVERDDTRARIANLEARVAELSKSKPA